MKLEIVQAGDPVLRQPAHPLSRNEVDSQEIQDLIQSMRKLMHGAPGVGLAAPQVGLSLQLAVIEDREEYHKDVPESQLRERERHPVPFHVIINPKIADYGSEMAEFFEGCLSLQGFSALVPRSRSVRVECFNECGEDKVIEASGWYARILQHEIDHLRGNLYIDRMHARTFTSLENWTNFWKGRPVSEIIKALGTKPD